MKRITLLVLFLGLYMSQIIGQEPNLPHVSYSTKKGSFKDTRDGKTYAFKQYGDYDWFMQNLNWDGYDGVDESTRGTVGFWGSADPDGSKFGRFYPGNLSVCPAGWNNPNNDNWGTLITAISTEYDAPDLKDPTGNKYTFKEAMKYMRGGEVKANLADALWDDETGTVDSDKANKIQFNILPMGEHDGTDYVANFGVGKMMWLRGGGKDRYQNNPKKDDTANGINALRHSGADNKFGAVRCVRMTVPDVQITTPYPTTLEISQITSTEKEVDRHLGKMKRFDHVPTGFYVEENKTVKIKLTTLTPAADGAIPQIVIGTRGQMPVFLTTTSDNRDGQKITEVNLKEGVNTIVTPSDPRYGGGGIIYFRYVTKGDAAPVGKIKIEILDGDQIRAPHYVDGTTTDDEFIKMMSEYMTPEVIFTSDEVVAVTSRIGATDYSLTTDKKLWIEHLQKLLALEDEISGMDDKDPNPLHHRMKKGEIRHLFVQTRNPNPNASEWRVAYPAPRRYLTPFQTPTNGHTNVSWQVAHEIGHQHQQNAYLIPQAGESTVNIYSFVVAAFFDEGGKEVYVRTPDKKLEIFHRTYLKLPDDKRKYEMPDKELEAIIETVNRDELRMVPWELQFYIFGNDFFKRLHRVTREERVTNSGVSEQNDRRKVYLITRASLISGYDLRKYYKAWGIVVDNPNNQKRIDRIIEDAKLQEPPRIDELALVSGEKFVAGEYKGWLPLSMDKGITTSVPENWDWDAGNEAPKDRLASKEKYCDYSTKDGDFTDTRDGKKYPFKTYGTKMWFMTNLDWDGYDGVNEATKGTQGLNTPEDPEGKVYGRYYPTNVGSAISKTWCPDGWNLASKSQFEELSQLILDKYGFADKADAVKCMKCGGDRDDVTDGLWGRGMGDIDVTKSNEIGINILPGGVWDRDKNAYETQADQEGEKGSIIEAGYYHNVFESTTNEIQWKNRFMRHSASVRCVKNIATGTTEQTITFPAFPEKVLETAVEFPAGATASSGLEVTYKSSDATVATVINGVIKPLKIGTTTITASQFGNDEFKPTSVEQVLNVLKDVNINKEQTITFPKFGEVTESSVEFAAGATASSGLEVTYKSSDVTVATVVNGMIKPLKPGTTTITASQAGNKEFLPVSLEQVLNVAKDTAIPAADVDVKINGTNWDKASVQNIPCNYVGTTMLLAVDNTIATIILNGVEKSEHEIDITKVGSKPISFTVKTSEDEKVYTLSILKDLAFEDVVATKWGNTYIVNNNPNNNGGYTFIGYKWFANGTEVSNKQYYYAEGKTSTEFKLELTTANGVIKTCPTTLTPKGGAVKVYPVPVNAGEMISIDASDMPAEFVDGSANIYMFGMSGYSSKTVKLKDATTQIQAPSAAGLYIIKVVSNYYEKEFKVIVK